MNLYKKVYIPNFIQIQSKLLPIALARLRKNQNDAFVVDRVLLETSVPELFDFFNQHSLVYDTSRIFQTAPDSSLAIHVDGNNEWPKLLALNIPIIGCIGTTMYWWRNVLPTVSTITSEYGKNIQLFDGDDKQVIGQLELTEPYMVKIDVPHSVSNPGNQYRIILTVRFAPEPVDFYNKL